MDVTSAKTETLGRANCEEAWISDAEQQPQPAAPSAAIVLIMYC